MPVYTFVCKNCKKAIEIEQKINERRDNKLCPKCSQTMSVQLQPTAFHLNGTGWYVTDYKNKDKTK